MQVRKPLEDADIPIPEIGSSDVLIRVAAAGICHSDAHYRAGISKIEHLPLTLGHEVAGRVEEVGSDVTHLSAGDRVCVHYLVHCGNCKFCGRGLEQFCRSGQMIGKHRDGGYAEFIKVPGANAFPLPHEIPFEVGAIMMCSSATALHALNKARFKAGSRLRFLASVGSDFRYCNWHSPSIAKMSMWVKSIVRSSRQPLAWEPWRSTPGPQIRSSKSKRQRLGQESMSHSN